MYNQKINKNELSVTIAYAMPTQKIETVIQPSLIAHAKDRDINLVQLDINKPLIEQGPFDCLLHKIYDENWNTQLLEFKSKYRKIIIIDSPQAIAKIHNRISMLDVVNDLKIPLKESISKPNQVVLANANDLNNAIALSNNFQVLFPVLAKPMLANSSDKSHEMSLVFNNEGLKKVQPPVVVQEFVNHGGVLFKVYVAGDYVKCVKRRSLPNFDANCDGSKCDIMSFSQISSNGDLDDDELIKEAKMPCLSFVQSVAKELREGTKLNLFNFDMIRDERVEGGDDKYLIIDINYFPGYAKVPGFESMLTDFFWDVVNHNNVNGVANGIEDAREEK